MEGFPVIILRTSLIYHIESNSRTIHSAVVEHTLRCLHKINIKFQKLPRKFVGSAHVKEERLF